MFLLLLFCACTDQARRSELDSREAHINEKQEQLIALERKIIQKERERMMREKMLDSLNRALRVEVLPDSLTNDTLKSQLIKLYTGTGEANAINLENKVGWMTQCLLPKQ